VLARLRHILLQISGPSVHSRKDGTPVTHIFESEVLVQLWVFGRPSLFCFGIFLFPLLLLLCTSCILSLALRNLKCESGPLEGYTNEEEVKWAVYGSGL
jgi:hypothetical protein